MPLDLSGFRVKLQELQNFEDTKESPSDSAAAVSSTRQQRNPRQLLSVELFNDTYKLLFAEGMQPEILAFCQELAPFFREAYDHRSRFYNHIHTCTTPSQRASFWDIFSTFEAEHDKLPFDLNSFASLIHIKPADIEKLCLDYKEDLENAIKTLEHIFEFFGGSKELPVILESLGEEHCRLLRITPDNEQYFRSNGYTPQHFTSLIILRQPFFKTIAEDIIKANMKSIKSYLSTTWAVINFFSNLPPTIYRFACDELREHVGTVLDNPSLGGERRKEFIRDISLKDSRLIPLLRAKDYGLVQIYRADQLFNCLSSALDLRAMCDALISQLHLLGNSSLDHTLNQIIIWLNSLQAGQLNVIPSGFREALFAVLCPREVSAQLFTFTRDKNELQRFLDLFDMQLRSKLGDEQLMMDVITKLPDERLQLLLPCLDPYFKPHLSALNPHAVTIIRILIRKVGADKFFKSVRPWFSYLLPYLAQFDESALAGLYKNLEVAETLAIDFYLSRAKLSIPYDLEKDSSTSAARYFARVCRFLGRLPGHTLNRPEIFVQLLVACYLAVKGQRGLKDAAWTQDPAVVGVSIADNNFVRMTEDDALRAIKFILPRSSSSSSSQALDHAVILYEAFLKYQASNPSLTISEIFLHVLTEKLQKELSVRVLLYAILPDEFHLVFYSCFKGFDIKQIQAVFKSLRTNRVERLLIALGRHYGIERIPSAVACAYLYGFLSQLPEQRLDRPAVLMAALVENYNQRTSPRFKLRSAWHKDATLCNCAQSNDFSCFNTEPAKAWHVIFNILDNRDQSDDYSALMSALQDYFRQHSAETMRAKLSSLVVAARSQDSRVIIDSQQALFDFLRAQYLASVVSSLGSIFDARDVSVQLEGLCQIFADRFFPVYGHLDWSNEANNLLKKACVVCLGRPASDEELLHFFHPRSAHGNPSPNLGLLQRGSSADRVEDHIILGWTCLEMLFLEMDVNLEFLNLELVLGILNGFQGFSRRPLKHIISLFDGVLANRSVRKLLIEAGDLSKHLPVDKQQYLARYFVYFPLNSLANSLRSCSDSLGSDELFKLQGDLQIFENCLPLLDLFVQFAALPDNQLDLASKAKDVVLLLSRVPNFDAYPKLLQLVLCCHASDQECAAFLKSRVKQLFPRLLGLPEARHIPNSHFFDTRDAAHQRLSLGNQALDYWSIFSIIREEYDQLPFTLSSFGMLIRHCGQAHWAEACRSYQEDLKKELRTVEQVQDLFFSEPPLVSEQKDLIFESLGAGHFSSMRIPASNFACMTVLEYFTEGLVLALFGNNKDRFRDILRTPSSILDFFNHLPQQFYRLACNELRTLVTEQIASLQTDQEKAGFVGTILKVNAEIYLYWNLFDPEHHDLVCSLLSLGQIFELLALAQFQDRYRENQYTQLLPSLRRLRTEVVESAVTRGQESWKMTFHWLNSFCYSDGFKLIPSDFKRNLCEVLFLDFPEDLVRLHEELNKVTTHLSRHLTVPRIFGLWTDSLKQYLGTSEKAVDLMERVIPLEHFSAYLPYLPSCLTSLGEECLIKVFLGLGKDRMTMVHDFLKSQHGIEIEVTTDYQTQDVALQCARAFEMIGALADDPVLFMRLVVGLYCARKEVGGMHRDGSWLRKNEAIQNSIRTGNFEGYIAASVTEFVKDIHQNAKSDVAVIALEDARAICVEIAKLRGADPALSVSSAMLTVFKSRFTVFYPGGMLDLLSSIVPSEFLQILDCFNGMNRTQLVKIFSGLRADRRNQLAVVLGVGVSRREKNGKEIAAACAEKILGFSQPAQSAHAQIIDRISVSSAAEPASPPAAAASASAGDQRPGSEFWADAAAQKNRATLTTAAQKIISVSLREATLGQIDTLSAQELQELVRTNPEELDLTSALMKLGQDAITDKIFDL